MKDIRICTACAHILILCTVASPVYGDTESKFVVLDVESLQQRRHGVDPQGSEDQGGGGIGLGVYSTASKPKASMGLSLRWERGPSPFPGEVDTIVLLGQFEPGLYGPRPLRSMGLFGLEVRGGIIRGENPDDWGWRGGFAWPGGDTWGILGSLTLYAQAPFGSTHGAVILGLDVHLSMLAEAARGIGAGM